MDKVSEDKVRQWYKENITGVRGIYYVLKYMPEDIYQIWYEKKFGKTRDRITDVLRIELRKIKENEERVSS
jgi:hypothetical protein